MNAPRIGSLFSGAGMLDEGVRAVLGGSVAWHSEVDPAACKVLAHRYPNVPNLGDVTAVDWSQVEPVDVITGGSPCQDVSHAGKRAGMRVGTRSGLWAAMVDAIDILRPQMVIWENVRGVLSAEADSALEPCAGCVGDADDGPVLRALGRVLGDLAELGYDTQWHGLRAADVGAPHGRFRIFVVARNADGAGGWVRGYGETSGAGCGRSDETRPAVWGVADRSGAAHSVADAERVGRARRSLVEGRGPVERTTARWAGSDIAADTGSGSLPRLGATRDGLRLASERRDEPTAVDWVQYGPAIHRWERTLGRLAPPPTETGPKGGQRLSPRFTEWMMGWPDGWVTDVPDVSRNDALKICGNGVVWQQAAEALRRMLAAQAVAA